MQSWTEKGKPKDHFCITSFPYTIRWWVVIRDLKTTTQLLLVVLSNKLSASCGMFTFISFVHWIKSAIKKFLFLLSVPRRKINNIPPKKSVHSFYVVIFLMKTEGFSSKINIEKHHGLGLPELCNTKFTLLTDKIQLLLQLP